MPQINRDRTYSEKEVHQIINRAISHQEADHQDPDDGLSIDEIERLAKEVGIDAKYVLMAVAEMQRPSKKTVKHNALLGGPTVLEFERTFEGSLTDETIAQMTREIRKNFKNQRGNLDVIGASFEWSSSIHSSHDLYIEGQTQDGQTRLYIRQRFDSWAILSYFWLFFPTILSAPLIMEQGLAGGIGALIAFAIVAMIGRFSFGLSTRKRSEKLTDLLSTLESIATRSRVTTGTSSGEQTKQEVTEANTTKMQTQPLLNLDALPEQPIAEANQARMPQRNVYGGLD